ncbi:MAG: IclR family transcriptional regulator [Pseudonocardia sp.]
MISKITGIFLAITEVDGPTLTEIATRSRLPLFTTHRLANELLAWGLLDRDAEGRYRVGSPLRAHAAEDPPARQDAGMHLRERIAPVMDDLFRETGAHVRAGLLDGSEVAYIEKLCAHRPVTCLSAAARLPAHATALGKVLLAFSPTAETDLIVARRLKGYTRATITEPGQLRRSLRTIRVARIALSNRELNEDWCGVAVPVFGPDGMVWAAIELRVQDFAAGLAAVRAPLAIAAACLSRDLAHADGGLVPGFDSRMTPHLDAASALTTKALVSGSRLSL